ncbi:hypothetical protein [Shewanella sp. 10N.286.54.B9]|uniref:aspartate-alanine antiporter-like transporter n=1 Tax=Shewanella sp. 10N.286.54.B9 TaxID=3229719 RepID=UPI0035516E00
MGTLQYILNTSPYFPILATLVFGFLIGKITIGRFYLGSILGILIMGVVIGQIGVEIDPSLRWILFGLFMYVVGYQGCYQFINTLQIHKKSILLASILMSVVPLIAVAIASQLFDIGIYTAIGIAAGSFIHPEIMSVTTEAIQQFVGLSNQGKTVAINELYMGYALTVIFGIAGPVIILKWIFPIMVKWNNTDKDLHLQQGSFYDNSSRGNRANTVANVVRRSFQVNVDSTVIGKTIQQLNAPSVDVTFELESNDKDESSHISAGDIITITGRSNTLFYFDDNILGSELSLEDNVSIVDGSTMVMISASHFVGSTLQQIKRKVNENTFREVCFTRIVRARKEILITPEIVLQKNDILQLTGNDVDIKLAESYFKTFAEDAWYHQLLFGFGLVIAYLISLWHISLGGLYLYFSLGITSLISGGVIGYLCNRNVPLALFPNETACHIRRLSLAGFVAISGLYFGPITMSVISDVGVDVFLIGCGVVITSQLVSFAICYLLFRLKSSADISSIVNGSHSAGIGFPDLYGRDFNRSVIFSFSVSYVSSSVLMLMMVSIVLRFIPS